jgi:hypothetical protein
LLATAGFGAFTGWTFSRLAASALAASAFAVSDLPFDAGALSGTTGGGNATSAGDAASAVSDEGLADVNSDDGRASRRATSVPAVTELPAGAINVVLPSNEPKAW